MENSELSQSSDQTTHSGSSPLRILKVVVILACLGGVAAAGWVYRWDEKISQSFSPSLVEVTGQVIYEDGMPVSVGQLQVQSLKSIGGRQSLAVGFLDKQGRFKLITDIEGTYHDGAYVGEHRVAVKSTGETIAGGGAPPAVALKYFTLAATPLRIEVTSNPEDNIFVIKLEGTRPAPRSAGGGGGGGGENSVEDLVQRIMGNDKDSDGKISKDEASDRLKPNFDKNDTNSDGFLDEAEVKQLVESFSGQGSPEETDEKTDEEAPTSEEPPSGN